MLDVIERWVRLLAQRIGVQGRRPDHRGINLGVDIRNSSLPQPSLIFDVGAHRGESLAQFTSWFPRARVHCFEPAAKPFIALRKQAGNNPRIVCINAALGDTIGPALLYVRRGTDNSSLNMYEGQDPSEYIREQQMVGVNTLDAYCASEHIEAIDLLKIDTEGFDLKVLLGGRFMFERSAIGIVQVEAGMSPENTKHVPHQAFEEFFMRYNYRIFGFYEQVSEWTTKRPFLRRGNMVFISPFLARVQ
jgi:FkbM family methyltransferase